MAANIQGHTAYITGASGGIGSAIATKFAEAGCKLYLVGQSEEKLSALKEKIRSEFPDVQIITNHFDITDKTALANSVAECIEKLGSLSILVNNAGVGCTIAAPIEKWEQVIDVNLKSVLRLTKLALPHLENSVMANLRSSIVNIASVSGLNYYGNFAPYCASKHGLVGWSGSLFPAIQNLGIKVTCINPGWVDTPMIHKVASYNPESCITPEQVAYTTHFAVTFPGNACPTEITLWPQFE